MRNLGIYAQHFHLTPEQGLLNDPNGLCYFKGYYHVFYQYNPHATDHSIKYWGHLRSRDLKTWEQLPIALKSEDWFDKDGVYSGSAVVKDNELYLFYTGNTKDAQGIRTSYQCLATSQDGIHFTKHGPITEQLSAYTGHIRDPKVWYDEELHGWWMLLGAQLCNKTGDTVAFFSTDLRQWDYRGSILQFDEPVGYMWECPDMLFLVDQVTGEEKAVFVFSPQGLEIEGQKFHNIHNTTYLVGQWDNKHAQFIPDNMDWHMMEECDRGFEFYAPQSFVDVTGRVIQYGWMGMMWPDHEAAVPTRDDNWLHHLSIPRVLTLRNGRLVAMPMNEMQELMIQEIQVDWANEEIHLALNQQPHRVLIEGEVAEDWSLCIDEVLTVHYEAASRCLTLSRLNWFTNNWEQRQVTLEQALTHVELWLDTSSVECFVNHGAVVLSARYFAQQPLQTITGTSLLSGELRLSLWSLAAYQYEDA